MPHGADVENKSITRAKFRQLVKDAGGPEAAAKIMGVKPATVKQAFNGGMGLIGEGPITNLRRAAGDFKPVKSPQPGNGAGDPVFFTAEALKGVESLRFSEDPDGFQREINTNQVAKIENLIRDGFTKFPPIALAKLPGGRVVEIDGQHRRAAHMNTGIGCFCMVYQVESLEEARQMYLVWNGRARKPTSYEAFMASRNRVAMKVKSLQETYGLTFGQAAGVVRGLIGSLMDFVAEDADISKDMMARANAILTVWTKDARWGREKSDTFNSHMFLRALGHFARQFSPAHLKTALDIIRARADAFYEGGTWTVNLRKHGVNSLSKDLTTYVAPHCLGGLTGKKANRGGGR